jgi:hypothetical protein
MPRSFLSCEEKKKLIQAFAERIIAGHSPVKEKLVGVASGQRAETPGNSRPSCVRVKAKYI